MTSPDAEQRYSFEFVNDLQNPLTLWLEPAGDRYSLEPGDAVRLEVVGPPGRARLQNSDHALTLWTWAGCRYALYSGDRLLRAHGEPPVE